MQRMESLNEAMQDACEFDPLILANMFHLRPRESLENPTPQLLAETKELSRKSL